MTKKAKPAAPKSNPRQGEPELDRRKTSILGTVVYEYVATGEPVGSATLTQKYNLGISPATVRAELASLDEEGYLDQPHTSAGRVPSDRGYRYYVDRLMLPETLAPQERERIRAEVRQASHQLDSVVERWIAPRPSAEVFAAFDAAEAAIAPVYRMGGRRAGPHVIARDGMIEVDGVRMQGPTARLSLAPAVIRHAGRSLVADTDYVLAQLECGST